MRRELLAMGVIALLVLTIFGSVGVTGQSTSVSKQSITQSITQSNKQSINVKSIVVKPADPYAIKPTVPSTWTGTQYNVHNAFVVSTDGKVALTQSAKGSALATNASVAEIYYGKGTNVAYLGVQWHLKPGTDWAKVKGAKVLVTASVSYHLFGGLKGTKGSSSSSVALIGGDPTKPKAFTVIHSEKGDVYDVSVLKPVTASLSTTLENVSTANGQGIIAVTLMTDIVGAAGGASTAASGDVTVNSIQLTWL